jgi:single-stranded DNA-specific DHH superfamily exonuclease
LENFENNKIINQLMDDFDNKNEENNSEDINFKQSKDEKINIYDDFDNDSEKIK